ncbi:MAG TPA: cyclic nucleotide-binding domain-containing protein, partial [Solirubrobacteraceae bacterium]|nr:cyclic nucleotide-binding domain-containing protein [Solirubrobacteraceae bacterium]
AGFTHYDPPPPDRIADIDELCATDRFRFANVLSAWIEVNDAGRISDCGYSGGGLMGSTTIRVGPVSRTFQAISLPDLRKAPVRGDGWVRFVQTTGGRTALPAPRRVRRRPFVQWQCPLVWTTLTLTIHLDGSADASVEGHSRFPRHWIYDNRGRLSAKSGLADFEDWFRTSFGRHTPWGDTESAAMVTAVETALERQLSAKIMSAGVKPRIAKIAAGEHLVRQGEAGSDVFLLLDGVLLVEKDGERLAEYGPGALLGERAHLEKGGRTSSLIAVTPCRVAAVDAAVLDRSSLQELSKGHRREHERAAGA